MGKSENDIEGTIWDTVGRGGTRWDTFDEINSLTTAIKMEIQKRCKYCGVQFIAHKMTTLYCSPSCNDKDYRKRIREGQISKYLEQEAATQQRVTELDGKAFLTPREAAKLLGIGKSSVYRELASGMIKAVQMKGKTLIRRKDIEAMFDKPAEYQPRTGKKHEDREYYTLRQIVEKFKCSRKAVWNRCEKFGIHKVYRGRNTFFDKALVDIHFAELLVEVNLADYYTVAQLMEKYSLSKQAVLSFVSRHDIPRITQGRVVYYSKLHVDTFKGERECMDPNYYTYEEAMQKYGFSKDRVSYYVRTYNIPSQKQGRYTLIDREAFDKTIKERMETNSLAKELATRKKLDKTLKIPDGFINVKQIAEKYGVTEKSVQARTRENKIDKIVVGHLNYYNESDVDKLYNSDPEKFDVPEGYISAEQVAERFQVTVAHVYNRTRKEKVPKIIIKNFNFYELNAVEQLFGNRLTPEDMTDVDPSEWITGEEIEQLYGMTEVARRTFVSRHKIPCKKVHEIAYYSKTEIEYERNPGLRDKEKYYTVEQITEKFGLPREEMYALARSKHIEKKRDGRFVLFLKEDVIKAIHERNR